MSKIIVGGHEITVHKDYSTSEVFTGQYWIDGKKIYRKVYDQEITTYTDYTKIRVFEYREDNWRLTHNLIKADGYFTVTYGSNYEVYAFGTTVCNASDGTITVSSRILSHPTNNRLYLTAFIVKSDNATSVHFYTALYYTKTTD